MKNLCLLSIVLILSLVSCVVFVMIYHPKQPTKVEYYWAQQVFNEEEQVYIISYGDSLYYRFEETWTVPGYCTLIHVSRDSSGNIINDYCAKDFPNGKFIVERRIYDDMDGDFISYAIGVSYTITVVSVILIVIICIRKSVKSKKN